MLLPLLLTVLLGFAGLAWSCSYDDANLINWDTVAAWDSSIPAEDEYATIRSGKHVRLNVSPPNLKGITIEEGASLVWGNYDDLVVTTDFIHIKGKFIIGDESCPFTKKAHIKLTGKSNTDNTVAKFGMKFIGVDVNGTLELHGAEKKSWTRLIQTMPAALDTCGAVFNFKDSVFNNEMARGLFVMALDTNGRVFDFNIFKTQDANNAAAEDKFQSFVTGIPDDKYLVIAVNGDLGTTVSRDWEKIYTTVETVGGLARTELRDVVGREAYAFIMKKGDTSTTKEDYVANNLDTKSISTDRLIIYDENLDLEFSVVGTVFNSSNSNRGIDIRVLTGEVAYPIIKLDADVTSWNTGDSIVVASTDFDWRQVEEFQLIDCGGSCGVNEVRLDHPFEYMHYGEITYGVDEMAEVGLLTRSILIEGVLEDECYEYDTKDAYLCDKFHKDTHGGHIKIIRGFTAAHVENAELLHMGQQKFVGSYALHFHMCDDVEGNWFRHNSVHQCESRCFTIHGTDRAEVSDNVCFMTKGHSIFLEDSCEQWNIIDGNLVIGTEFGTHLLSDAHPDWVEPEHSKYANALSSYWLTHPNNYIRNNVAAGSDNVGFWHIVANNPLGPCKARQDERGLVGEKHAFHSKILQFDDCVSHSCLGRGWRIDHRIANTGDMDGSFEVPENGVLGAQTTHVPKDPPQKDGTLVTSVAKRFRAYKNKNQNVWTKAGNLVMEEFTFADTDRNLAMARAFSQTFTEVKDSLFIGETDNIGLPKEPWGRSYPGGSQDALQGVKFYQGPGYVTNCLFDKFDHKYSGSLFRPAGALSFKRKSPYPSAPNSGVRGIKYGFCDGPDSNWVFRGNVSLPGFGNRDGDRQASFHDYDGSVTGAAGSQVVQNNRFFTTDRCLKKEFWGVTVCPYEYARVIFKGSGGTFDVNDDNYALYMRRDDRPADDFALIGERGDNYLVMKNMSYTVYFNGTIPDEVSVSGENLETGDFVRVGFCFSSDSEFSFSSGFPKINSNNPPVEADTIEELDADTTGTAYFWDQPRGLLFVKVVGFSPVLDKENCPGRKCPSIKITRTAGTAGVYDCYNDAYVNGPYTKQEDDSTAIPTPATCTTTTAYQNYGAPAVAAQYATEDFDPSCRTTPSYPTSVYKGCFKDVFSYRDLPYEEIEISQSLTVDFCVQRCYRRNYPYAAAQDGFRCLCGNFYGAYDETPDDCTKPCRGNSSQMCGASSRNSVYSTGIATIPDLPTCRGTGAQINNKCYYLTSESTVYVGGQRACVKLGGNLATITTENIQRDVEQYMRPQKVDAWFGLNDVISEGTFQYVDGTAVSSYDNIMAGQLNTNSQDGYMLQAANLYAWNDRGIGESHQALCEMDLNAVAPSGVSCGRDGLGKRFGSGSCYAVVNELRNRAEAEITCNTRLGSLVEVTDQNREEVLRHVYVYGDSIDYWTGDEDETGSPVELTFNKLYSKSAATSGTKNGAVCLLNTDTSNICPEPWKRFGDMCYLYTARWLSYEKALSLCDQGASGIVTIPNADVNAYVAELVHNVSSTQAYIGFKYNQTSQVYEWDDEPFTSYTNWRSGEGDLNTGETDYCARIRSWDGQWKNRDCTKGGLVVCQSPVGQ